MKAEKGKGVQEKKEGLSIGEVGEGKGSWGTGRKKLGQP